MGTTTAPLFCGMNVPNVAGLWVVGQRKIFLLRPSILLSNLTYSILPGSQETVLRLAPLADCVCFVDVVEVGELVEVVDMASVPLFKGANPIAPLAGSLSM